MLQKIIFFLFLLVTQAGMANMPNYNSIIIGDQAAGMGGAYTAMGEDPSAIPWYNPAAMAWLKEQAFSASVGIYKKYDTAFNKTSNFVDAALQSSRGYFKPIPSSTSNIVRFRDEKFEISKLDLLEYARGWTLGLSIVVPYSDQFNGVVSSENNNESSLNFMDEHLWVGGAAARPLNDTSAFGFTIYYTARTYNRSVNDTTYVNATDFTVFNEEKIYKQNSLVAVLGYHKRLTEAWKFGASLRLPNLPLHGKGTYSEKTITNAGYTPVATSEVDTKQVLPAKLTLGVAYDIPSLFTLAADISYSPGNFAVTDINKPGREDYLLYKDVMNISLGGEYHFNSWFKIRAGIFTNFAAHPDPDPSRTSRQGDHVDQMGFSANAALIKKSIQYTFGGYYVGGWGRSVQRVNQAYVILPKTQHVFTMLVGTTFLY